MSVSNTSTSVRAICAHLDHIFQQNCSSASKELQSVRVWVENSARSQPRLLGLPLLTCEAAGGEPVQAIPVASAWHLLHCAAHLLDDVADGALLSLGPAQTVTAAVTLVFLSQVSLVSLTESGVGLERVVDIIGMFNKRAAQMAQGQAADLSWDCAHASLDDYWRMAGAKTGEFFAMTCRAGAMLGRAPQNEIDTYGVFGYHLGTLLQVGDDLRAVWQPQGPDDLVTVDRTLPAVYALNVVSGADRHDLLDLIRRAAHTEVVLAGLQDRLLALGALHYAALQASQHRQLARQALLATSRPTVAQNELLVLLDTVFPGLAREQWTSATEAFSYGFDEHGGQPRTGLSGFTSRTSFYPSPY